MSTDELLHNAMFNRFELYMSEDTARSGSHQGPCDDDVRAISLEPEIAEQLDKINPADIAAELREYGAWDDAELSDNDANRQRIVWIACGNIRDDIDSMEED